MEKLPLSPLHYDHLLEFTYTCIFVSSLTTKLCKGWSPETDNRKYL